MLSCSSIFEIAASYRQAAVENAGCTLAGRKGMGYYAPRFRKWISGSALSASASRRINAIETLW